MRIARVLPANTSIPTLAIERDGALYDVAELDRHHDTRYSPDRLPAAAEFHTRLFGLSAAGLPELDEALRAGRRPRDARILPGSFVWLAPCPTERASWVHVPSGDVARMADEPVYAFGNPRALLGHDSSVPLSARERDADVELALAAVLAEDLRRATPAEAAASILGYTVAASWVSHGEEQRAGAGAARARDLGAQLGPLLIHPAEVGELAAAGVRLRIGGSGPWMPCGRVGDTRFSIAEVVSFVSDHVELHGGDVVSLGLTSTKAAGKLPDWGQSVELQIERVGTLVGRPVRGPDRVRWRA
jgi:2-keto-4-pentenoate hydratase/2-oxohepta-3-ene-1,7-dioic acid hydratase in catechol pathway